jgi:hypothetical protein
MSAYPYPADSRAATRHRAAAAQLRRARVLQANVLGRDGVEILDAAQALVVLYEGRLRAARAAWDSYRAAQ